MKNSQKLLDFCCELAYSESMKRIYSVKEASEAMGLSEQRVRKLLAEGRIEGTKLGKGTWLVTKLGYKRKKRGIQK